MKATPRGRKIALLGKFAYPELRLVNALSLSLMMSFNMSDITLILYPLF
ncbi:hypothetical protein PAUR_a1626 [Pseudoalteromonas aurantia 208]|uniref:Uncharacterized protein n=1 Tax=Pseudoalteromonas aurantia 208 TaxID=1314867 RepID=A0ABR9EEC9_9GAMM|nr:hypothetical protein [Pseudoalteromonas aurantia 208]